jgi:fatty-acyl-CoA synthase
MLGIAAFNQGAAEFARAAWGRRLPVIGLYGSSEAQALFASQPMALPLDERIEPGGRPTSPDAEVRVRDVDTGELLAPGASGELEIRSPTLFVGYMGDPEATAEAFQADGFFKTGDVGHLRRDGSFVFEARRGDAIRIAGYLVSPPEVEETLKRLPLVADALVVGVPIAGQTRICAFVIPAPVPGREPREAEVISAAAAIMAGFKVPARVWFVESFPTTEGPNGIKVQRAPLRELALRRVAEG